MSKLGYIETPTFAIYNAVCDYLESYGYRWRHGRPEPHMNYQGACAMGAVFVNANKILSYSRLIYAQEQESHREISLSQVEKAPMIEVTIKVNGKESKEPLSVETAKRLGIVK